MDWRESRAGKRWLALYGHRKKVRMTWLARARLLSGQSVSQAAKACGLSPRTWEAWERVGKDHKEPSVKAAVAIWRHYGDRTIDSHSLILVPYTYVNPATLEVVTP